MAHVVFCVSLAVIFLASLVVALHPRIPIGWFGLGVLCAIAVFSVAGLASHATGGFDLPPRWVVGLVAAIAGGCVWAFVRWRMECTRGVISAFHKVGGTD